MIFAAGFGTRMGDLTKTCPKPMIPVAGRPLIDHALDLTSGPNINPVIVNLHYLPDQLETHLANRSGVRTILERQTVLETGGGLKNALPFLGDNPVLTLNSDAVWTGDNPLTRLQNAWDPEVMDALLMLVPKENAQEHRGSGDFFLDETGRLARIGKAATAPFVYSGAQIVKTAPLLDIQEQVFSLNLLWDQYLADRRVFGIVHHGGWVDVGTPHGIHVAEVELARFPNV